MKNDIALKVSRPEAFSLSEPSSDGGIDFVWLPEQATFHATGDDYGLTGDMTGQDIGGEEDGRIGNIIGSCDLRECHGGSDFADCLGVGEFGCGAWNNGPTGTDAVDASTAVISRMWGDAGDFVFQGASEAEGHGRFGGGVISMACLAENASGGSDEHGIAAFLSGDDAEKFTGGKKG